VIPVDMPLDSARKLYRFLRQSTKEWDDLAEALEEACDKAGDGISISVEAH
jgi:hypothetical protein